MGSADASTIADHEPNTSICATPTFVTTTIDGAAIGINRATSPRCRAPSSAITISVSGGAPSNVIGTPTSLLNEDGLAWVRYLVAHTAAAMSLVEVLPFAPVIATTVPSKPRRSSAARSRSA